MPKPKQSRPKRVLDPAEEAEIIRRHARKEVNQTQVTVLQTLGFHFVRVVGSEKRQAHWILPDTRVVVSLGVQRATTYKEAVEHIIHAANTEMKNRLVVNILAEFDTRMTRQMLHDRADEIDA